MDQVNVGRRDIGSPGTAHLMEHHLGEYALGLLAEPAQPVEIDFGKLFAPVR